jgi:hypothetical protein
MIFIALDGGQAGGGGIIDLHPSLNAADFRVVEIGNGVFQEIRVNPGVGVEDGDDLAGGVGNSLVENV